MLGQMGQGRGKYGSPHACGSCPGGQQGHPCNDHERGQTGPAPSPDIHFGHRLDKGEGGESLSLDCSLPLLRQDLRIHD